MSFKVGDEVRCINATGISGLLHNNKIYTVGELYPRSHTIRLKELPNSREFSSSRFELVENKPKINLGPGAQVIYMSIFKGEWGDEIVLSANGVKATKDIQFQVMDPANSLWRNADHVEAGQTWRLTMIEPPQTAVQNVWDSLDDRLKSIEKFIGLKNLKF